MVKMKFELNRAGVRDLLRQCGPVCMEEAQKVLARCGPGYSAGYRNYNERSGAAVFPATEEAWRDNLENNTLEKAKGF